MSSIKCQTQSVSESGPTDSPDTSAVAVQHRNSNTVRQTSFPPPNGNNHGELNRGPPSSTAVENPPYTSDLEELCATEGTAQPGTIRDVDELRRRLSLPFWTFVHEISGKDFKLARDEFALANAHELSHLPGGHQRKLEEYGIDNEALAKLKSGNHAQLENQYEVAMKGFSSEMRKKTKEHWRTILDLSRARRSALDCLRQGCQDPEATDIFLSKPGMTRSSTAKRTEFTRSQEDRRHADTNSERKGSTLLGAGGDSGGINRAHPHDLKENTKLEELHSVIQTVEDYFESYDALVWVNIQVKLAKILRARKQHYEAFMIFYSWVEEEEILEEEDWSLTKG